MEIEKRDEIIALYEIYFKLLTDKQRTYFEDYYFYDLSITEIALNYDISRNAVFDQLKRVDKALKEYEDKLKIKEKIDKIENLNISDEIKNSILSIMKE